MRLQSQRFLTDLVEPGTEHTYPAFTGTEPCASIGIELYCDDIEHKFDDVLFKACNGCPLLKECFNWALHNERYYFWGGSSAAERKKLRKKLNIDIHERWLRNAEFTSSSS